MMLFKIAFVVLLISGLILGVHELWKKSLAPARIAALKQAFRIAMSIAGALFILSVIVSIF